MGALIWRKFRSAARLDVREKAWFFLLYPLSGLVRAAALFLPFRLVARYLGRHLGNVQVSPLADPEQVRMASRIGRSCDLVSRYTPWESKCLIQAAMAKTLLRHYGIPYAVYLGVTKSSAAGEVPGLKAHAWVAVGPRIVSGRDGHKAFTVVSTFVSPSLAPHP